MFVTIRKERNILPEVMPRDLAADYQQEYASRIVAVKLDNTLHDLQTPVGKSRSVEFVELESEEGWIIYRRTVEFLLIMAVHELYPEAEVAAMFRANNGLYCEISVPGKPLTPEMVTAIEREMRVIVQETAPSSRRSSAATKRSSSSRRRSRSRRPISSLRSSCRTSASTAAADTATTSTVR